MEKESPKETHEDPEIPPFITEIFDKVTAKYNYIIMLPVYILLIIVLLNIVQICLVCKILLNYRNKILY